MSENAVRNARTHLSGAITTTTPHIFSPECLLSGALALAYLADQEVITQTHVMDVP